MKHRTTNTQVALISIAAAAAVGTIGFGWALHHHLIRKRRQSHATDGNNSDDDDDPLDPSRNAETDISFPWEPRGKPQQHIYSQQFGPSSPSSRGNEKEQINFLAAMTFANGGLRAPNCLCCL
jgi:hypothetical protein